MRKKRKFIILATYCQSDDYNIFAETKPKMKKTHFLIDWLDGINIEGADNSKSVSH